MTVSAERPRLVLPGLLPADPQLERYRVHPGAVTAIELDPGDELTVIDAEGRQRGELTVFAGGREDYGALGTAADTAATVLRALARPGAPRPPGAPGPPGPDGDRLSEAEAAAVIGPLVARGLDPEQVRAVALFGEWSPAGTRAEFTAQQRLTCVVAAPGGLMGVDEHNPPSHLVIEVRRVTPRQPGEPRLPPPLADPVLDLRVDTATACSYEVKAGEYIQIIDVAGRQCSDFQAFNARRLDKGIERCLDMTATRKHDRSRLPRPRPLQQVLRPGPAAAGRGRARHRRPPRLLRPRLHGPLLRCPRLSRPRQLHRQLQRRARALRRSRRAAAGRPSTSSTTPASTPRHPTPGRAVVAAGRLCAAAGDDRYRLRLLGLPGRHRRRQRLEPDRHPRPRLSRRTALQQSDRLPHGTRRRAAPHARDRLPRALRLTRSSPNSAASGCPRSSTTTAPSTNTGPAARKRW